MLKMPTKTLLISAAVVLFAGCTTKQLPRPTAEIEQLRAQQPPTEQSLPNPVKGKRFDDDTTYPARHRDQTRTLPIRG